MSGATFMKFGRAPQTLRIFTPGSLQRIVTGPASLADSVA
jgi:hypothetical protein